MICDLQNNSYQFIPNGLYDILEAYNGKTIDFVKREFDKNYHGIIDEYFEFLVLNNFIFFNSNPDLFPKLSLEWDSPSSITNAIIDFDCVEHDFHEITQQLEELKCSYIQLRFFRQTDLSFIAEIAELVDKEKSRIISIDFIIPYAHTYSKKEIDSILEQNPRIHSIVLFSSPFNRNYNPMREKMGYKLSIKKIRVRLFSLSFAFFFDKFQFFNNFWVCQHPFSSVVIEI